MLVFAALMALGAIQSCNPFDKNPDDDRTKTPAPGKVPAPKTASFVRDLAAHRGFVSAGLERYWTLARFALQ